MRQLVPPTLNPAAAELIAERFRALGDPTRLRIINLLGSEEECAAGEIATAVGGSQQNVSKHLGVLHGVGFLARRKLGTMTLYRIADPAVLRVCEGATRGLAVQLALIEATLGPGVGRRD